MKKALLQKRGIGLGKMFSSAILFIAFVFSAKAQVNIAPNATVTASTCNTGPCTVLNDQNYGVCGSQLMWISTSSPPSPTPGVNWIEWNWPNAESFDEIVIHHAQDNARFLTGATIQYWDGSSWQNHHTFSNLPMQCINSITIPRLTTNRMRFTSFQMTGTGQTSNPNFREIEIFSAPTAPNDAGVSSLIAPVAFCPGQEDIIVRVQNFGINQITSVTVNWTLNGVAQTPVNVTTLLDTIGGVNPFFANVTLGSNTFAANTTYNIVAWTSMPNNVADTINFNDTLSVSISPAISGTYTINSGAATGGSNFQSFSDFANFLNVNGICGPVIANVVPNSGPYVERVEFDEIVGSSSVNTVTINGNGNILRYAGGANDRATMVYNGTDYFTVDNLIIEATGVSYGWTVHLTGNADHNTFTNCEFLSSTTSTSTFFSNIVLSSSPTSPTLLGASGSYNHFENNKIIGGYYGIAVGGASAASMEVGNTFINNEIGEWRYYGIYARAQDSMVIAGNDIHRETRSDHTFHRAMQFLTGMTNTRIEKNTIRDFHTGTGGTTNTSTNYIVYFSSASGSSGAPNVFSNNLIYNMKNEGAFYGIYNFNSSDWYVYHNTFALDFPSNSTALSQIYYHTSTGNNLEFKNNLLYLNRGGSGQQHMVYLNNASANINIEGNAYYYPDLTASNVHIGYSGGNHSSLANWQSVSGGAYDQNAVVADPFFVNLANDSLRPQNASLKFIGDNVLTYVNDDFSGAPRLPAPDPGAYQFEPPQGVDMAVVGFVSPVGDCPGTVDVTVNVANFASDTAETIRVNWMINNVPQTPVIITDSFYAGNIIPITLGSFALTAAGTFDIEVEIDSVYPGPDLDLSNNSDAIMGYRAGLDGTFTLNQLAMPTSTNFTSFEDFVDALNDYGVCGPVILNVVPGSGPYNEQIVFEEIQGASATNTITINGNGNTLSYSASGTADRTTVTFNGADYVTIDSLNIQANGTSFGWVMWITNSSNHNTFKNCVFETDDNSPSINYCNVVMSGSPTSGTLGGDIGNYNTFENNHHIGGYYGITMSGVSTAQRNVGNKVINSTFEDFYFYGMYLRSQDSLVIDGNDISRGGRTTLSTFYGIFLTQGNAGCQVINNRIHDNNTQNTTNTNAAYPIFLSSAQATAASPSILANNLLYNINNGGVIYALYFIGAANNFWKVYHNTVVVDQPNASSSSATRLIYFSGAQNNFEVKNNIFYLNRASAPGYYIHMLNAGATIDYDNNVFHTPDPSAMTFGHLGSDITDFADWQSNGFDLNGMEANPTFVGGTGNDAYRPTVGAIKNAGANVLSDVPTDIEGVARTTTPDPGVFQFDPLPCSGVYGVTVDTLYPGGTALSWTSVAPVNEWEIEWDICGFTPGSAMGNLVTVANNNGYLLDSLPMGHCVCVFIREVCPAGGFSDWSQAIEICVPIEDDAELMSVVNPEDMSCGDSLLNVVVAIRNNGFNAITSLPITVNITGDITETLNFTYTGNLQETEIDTVTVGSVNLYGGGYINIEAFTDLPNDQNLTNDSIYMDSLAIIPFQPVVDNPEFCPGDDSITLNAMPIPAGGYEWFDVATGGTPIATGPSITVPTTSGTLYIGYEDNEDSLQSLQQGGSGCGAGNMFDLTVNSTLGVTGFTVRPFTTATNAPISIYVVTGGYVGTTQADWTLVESGVIPVATANQPVRFDLTNPLILNANTTYGIYVQYNASYTVGANTYSNADMTMVAGLGLCSPFDYCCNPRTFNGAIHYGTEACSDIRTPVTPTAVDSVVANFDFTEISHTVIFQNTSLNADSVTWILDTLTLSGDSVGYQFPRTDSFEVCMIAYNLCGSDTICQWVWAENVSVIEHNLAGSLKVFPNPSEGLFNLQFYQPVTDDVAIELLDLSGKSLWTEVMQGFVGPYEKQFSGESIASGVYMLRIRNGDGVITRRVIISK
ncbi:MAG: T9SS type A sorting domain-containing protein [Cryomorphaceae bacterium]|nr:T9SS type A sorting domain-containing protein [Cryomorphaceae bacterium]